ncbi:MAG: T9SS type A sorting domain-containing protein, partial [Bacteroidia bacterium]|nr:T9SS type A sorting domain-containing protein [Bacteroidia bacterium]
VTVKLLYPSDSLFKLVVTNIDSNLFLTGYRKFIGLKTAGISMWGGGCDNDITWIDGMGGNGLFYNEFPQGACFDGYSYDMVCFWHKGVYVFGGTFCDYTTGINEIKTNDKNLQLYPNPANNAINIVFNDEDAVYAIVEIRNVLGKLIERMPLKVGVPYNYTTNSLESAIYFISFYVDGKLVEKRKLILIK